MHDFIESPELLARLSMIVQAHATPMVPMPTDCQPRLPRLTGIRAVIFDVYGTLFISGSGDIGVLQDDGGGALAEALEAAGLGGDLPAAGKRGVDLLRMTIREQHAAAHSRGIETPEVDIRNIWKAVAGRLVTEGLLQARPSHETILHLSLDYEMRVNPVFPMPGLEAVLAQLAEARLVLGIVSNAQFFTPVLFNAFLGALPEACGFDPHICAWSYRLLTAKPGQGLYRDMLAAAAKHYGLMPHDILYVGNDMRNDIWPAAMCGMRTALFAGDARSLRWRADDSRVAHVQPDVILTELAHLEKVLQLSRGAAH